MFGLRFSFIGWALLAALPLVVGQYIMRDMMITSPVVELLFNIIMEIPMYFVLAYIQVTNGIFYELASGHIRPVVTPTYANMYGNLNQNMPGNNQGFNQNMQGNSQGFNQNVSGNYNQGYGMQNPSVSNDEVVGEHQTDLGRSEAPVNESPASNTITNEVAANEVPNNNESAEADE